MHAQISKRDAHQYWKPVRRILYQHNYRFCWNQHSFSASEHAQQKDRPLSKIILLDTSSISNLIINSDSSLGEAYYSFLLFKFVSNTWEWIIKLVKKCSNVAHCFYFLLKGFLTDSNRSSCVSKSSTRRLSEFDSDRESNYSDSKEYLNSRNHVIRTSYEKNSCPFDISLFVLSSSPIRQRTILQDLLYTLNMYVRK